MITWDQTQQFEVKKEGTFLILKSNPLIAFPIQQLNKKKLRYVSLLKQFISTFEGVPITDLMVVKGLPEAMEGYLLGTIMSLHDYLSSANGSLIHNVCITEDYGSD